MSSVRQHLERLRETNDLVSVTERVHWDGAAAEVASEAIRHNCPVTLFENTSGEIRLASGVYGGADQFAGIDQQPWQRITQALDLGADCSYSKLVERLVRQESVDVDDYLTDEVATTVRDDMDIYDLGLPTTDDGSPLVSLGLLVVEKDGVTTWAPIRGVTQRSKKLRLSVPASFAEWCTQESDASVVFGVSAASLVAALQGWTQVQPSPTVPELAAGLTDVSMAAVGSRIVPADAEARIDGRMSIVEKPMADNENGPKAAWELTCDTATVDVETESIALREQAIVPFTPLGEPLTDDLHLTCLVETAKLLRRVNNYWGVSPVKWIQIPVEGRLGLCIVSSEILYAGFEWQLANTMFSFSKLFDKVLVLDEQADPTNLARAIDDMWVKAHPANDWVFSEPNASSAAAPVYRSADENGSRLYINATWDPRWDEEYIAPRVTFETTFSENVLESLVERWEELGLEELLGEQGVNDVRE
ncbi:UbiD family decarboxylase [Natrinema salsiterrestre]|uniref:UbiD family decarboxylase n=1 Tax=Natrinema salsiterrestre TaxID=2950540 RepID=A0A9Q4Q4F1_9EURY|nr:UbiD family decarboxylase [Natrinema salsiterrestre]MDF9748516.1 UbiD family decarboxylase [Natrinema salsiterrestre]